MSLGRLRELARQVWRNDGWAISGVAEIANNTVGWGIEPKAQGSDKPTVDAADKVWRDWSTNLAADYDGLLWFAGLTHLAMQTVAVAGEILILKERGNRRDGLPVPLRIRLIEGDYIDSQKDGVTGPGGGPIVQGIELDGRGRRVAYWLFPHHPGSRQQGISFTSNRVPASDVIHLYDVARPGQMRGVTWLAAAISTIQDLGDFEDAALVQQRAAACFAAFVTDLTGSATAIGDHDKKKPLLEGFQPGMIEYLQPGQDITSPTPPQPVSTDFANSYKQRIAASVGVTPEGLTGDYKGLPFSAARMSRLAFQQRVDSWRWHMLIPRMCDGVWNWVMELASAMRGWPEVPTAEWTPPPMPVLNPAEEAKTFRDKVRSGQETLPEALRGQGIQDPEAHLQEIARSNARLTALGIVLDSDPREVSLAGQEQPSQAISGE